jgi:hypothetical protein
VSGNGVITTNNVPRDVIDAWDLCAKERDQFDYLDWVAIHNGRESAEFVRYKGRLEYLGNFLAWQATSVADAPHWMDRWDGYTSDSFFSGLVIRYVDNGERVVIGSYYIKG